MSIKFEFLQHNGESILITIDENQSSQHTILLDGGCTHPFNNNFFQKPHPKINTVIITHVDHDHIEGIIQLLQDKEYLEEISNIIFNEPVGSKLFSLLNNEDANTSFGQGSKLKSIIKDVKNITHINDVCFEYNNIIKINANTSIEILTPTKKSLNELHTKWNKDDYEQSDYLNSSQYTVNAYNDIESLSSCTWKKDRSLPNKSSIAFILHHNGYKFLLLGDAHIDEVNESLKTLKYTESNPLSVEFVKLSHHGSNKNINLDFLSLIETNDFVVFKAYEGESKHPNRETLAKIAKFGAAKNKAQPIIIHSTKDLNSSMRFQDKEKDAFGFKIKTTQKIKY